MGLAMCIGGLFLFGEPSGSSLLGLLLMLGSIALVVLAGLAHRGTTWSLTSDRLIERRDMFASSHQEMELIDVRSIEVSRSLLQRLLGLGTVAVASAASAEFLIIMSDIRDPQHVADTVRQARLASRIASGVETGNDHNPNLLNLENYSVREAPNSRATPVTVDHREPQRVFL